MSVTLFGTIWIFAIAYCFFSADDKKIIFIALFSMIFQSNNILAIGDTNIGVQIFTVSVALIRLWLVGTKDIGTDGVFPLDKKVKPNRFAFSMLFIAVLASLWYNNSLGNEKIISVSILAIYILFAFTLIKGRINITFQWLEKTENIIVITVLIIGFLQMFTKMGLLPLEFLLRTFVYNDVLNTNVIFNFKTTSAFYSTFMEPSYCGALLVGLFALIMLREKPTGKNITLLIFIIIAIVSTRSSTAYGGLAVILVVLCLVRAQKRIFKVLVPILIFGVFIFASFNMDVLNEVIFEKSDTSSYLVRSNWNTITLNGFYSSPIFGVGYTNARASSLFYCILGELGLFGLASYSLIFWNYLKFIIKDKVYSFITGRSLFVVGIITCQIIACPDLNFSPFWMAVFVQILAYTHYCKEMKGKVIT